MKGDILKSLRLDAGLTQQELAEKLGVSTISIELWETGQTRPTTDTLIDYEDFFNLYGELVKN